MRETLLPEGSAGVRAERVPIRSARRPVSALSALSCDAHAAANNAVHTLAEVTGADIGIVMGLDNGYAGVAPRSSRNFGSHCNRRSHVLILTGRCLLHQGHGSNAIIDLAQV